MDADLQPVYERVINATRPEDVFKEMNLVLPERLLRAHLEKEIKVYRTVLKAENYSAVDDKEAANMALARFEQLLETALESASKGLYNPDGFSKLPLPTNGRRIIVDGVEYVVGREIHSGFRLKTFEARFSVEGGSAAAIIKVANTSADNFILGNEIRILNRLHREVEGKEFGHWRYLPFVFGRFSAGSRTGIVERFFEGVTLVDVRNNVLHRQGLDQRHVVWVMDRTLSLLGYVHRQGVVHGGIKPFRIRVRPSNHNVLLTGWGRAVYKPAITGESIDATNSEFEAPEVSSGKEIGPWTDVYGLGKTLIWLIGGNPFTNQIPEVVEPKVQRFLLNMVHENPRARPRDAWQLYRAQINLKDSLWERRFLHLDLA